MTLRPGRVLGGRYRLRETLGDGRFATVWLARDEKMNASVALKVLREGLVTDAAARTRFAAEALLLGRFDSPHILRASDRDMEGPAPYFVMPALEGETLRERLDAGACDPLREDEVSSIARQLARAVEDVHAAQVVHGDIKPENVFVTLTAAGEPHVWLLDFGLATDLRADGACAEARPGTPRAMAPEQFGAAYRPNRRADVFSLGLVLRELATGETLHAGLSAAEVAAAYGCGEIDALTPGRHGLLYVSRRLSRMIAQATALDPSRRFADGREVARALEDALAFDPETLDPGRVFDGRYQIEGRLGRGGMGAVYRATDLDAPASVDETVALKLLALPRYVGEDYLVGIRKRFAREMEILIRLSHPHIAEIRGTGLCEGIPYYALELVEGRELAEAAGSLGWAGVTRVISQVASALSHAAERGVVHRDVKSPNILVDSGGNARLVDFGIARVDGSGLTEADVGIGTPGFRAPEQMRSARDATPASDQWALAATVYELLTGHPPGGAEVCAAGPDTLIAGMEPLSARAGVPAEVGAVVDRALAEDPDERYESAEAFAAALSETAGLAVAVVARRGDPVSETLSLGRPARRRPAPRETPFAASTAGGETRARRPRRVWRATGMAVLFVGIAGAMMYAALRDPERAAERPAAAHVADATSVRAADAAPAKRAMAGQDAGAAEMVVLRVETWTGQTQVRGVAFRVGDDAYVSPAEVRVMRGAEVTIQAEGGGFAGQATLRAEESGAVQLALTRVPSPGSAKARAKKPAKRPAGKKKTRRPPPIEPIEVDSSR